MHQVVATNSTTTVSPSKRLTTVLGFYLAAIAPVVFYAWLGHSQYLGSSFAESPYSVIAILQMAVLSFPLIMSTGSLLGILLFGTPRDEIPHPNWRWDLPETLIIAYVSRGNQPETLQRASSQTQAVLDMLGVRYSIELVTDVEIRPQNRLSETYGKLYYYLVPPGYETPRRARFKARALQYLLEQRSSRLVGTGESNVWVLHLDEESILTPECVLGISKHIRKYDLSLSPGAIGQGEILYNAHQYGHSLLIAAIDAARTGGDLGIFRLQYKAMHSPLVGMHGSFVLVPASIEESITWDVGGHGSITEDSYFALMAMQRGVRFDWVEGFIREQSPFTLMDILRQRRRWFCGLWQVARDPTLDFFTTIVLRLHVLFWAIAAITLPLPLIFLQQRYLFGNLILPYWLFLSAAICTGLYATSYCVGAYRNVLQSELSIGRKLSIIGFAAIAWFFYIPALVECAGTLYGLFFPVNSFYVVAKDYKSVSA